MNYKNDRTEKIMTSLDGLQKAAAPAYFYTRLTGKMQQDMEVGRKTTLLLRPAFAVGLLTVFLIVNIISIAQFTDQSKNKVTHEKKQATIQTFAEAYGLNTTTVYE